MEEVVEREEEGLEGRTTGEVGESAAEGVEEREMGEGTEASERGAGGGGGMEAREEQLDEGHIVRLAQYHTRRRRRMARPRPHMSVP